MNHAPRLTPVEIKPFVPASDLARSLRFYEAFGFEVPWSSDDLAYVRYGQTSFLLQAFAEPDFLRHYMMHMLVPSVDAWHAMVLEADVASRFGVVIGTPADRPWKMRDFTLTDPGGVLWRIAQNL